VKNSDAFFPFALILEAYAPVAFSAIPKKLQFFLTVLPNLFQAYAH